MISDTERREVARMLRELPGDSTYPDLIGVIADRDGWYPAVDAADRLADLIEPSEQKVRCVAEVKVDGERLERLAHDAAVKLTGIDRDALLALADEMFEDATGLAFISQLEKNEELQDLQSTMAKALMDYACRIREACGEVVG